MQKPIETIDGNKLYLPPETAAQVSHSISDVLCWLAGFQAADGNIDPINVDPLRAMSRALKKLDWQKPMASDIQAMMDSHAALLEALKNAVGCLEYVDNSHGGLPGLTGSGVRYQRIQEANKIIAAAESTS